MSNQIEYIKIDKICLDDANPRLPESYQTDDTITEESIINWLLDDASLIELMLAIGQNGFFVGEAILVINNGETYTVVEGNRRVSSVKLLNNPDLASTRKRKIAAVLEETTERPDEIPCIVFENRDAIAKYLGYRHVTGIKSWGLLAKARYLSGLEESLYHQQPIDETSKELAKTIGSTKSYVKRLLVGYKIYKIIRDSDFYKIPNLNEITFHFNYISDSLNREHIREYIDIHIDNVDPLEEFNEESEVKLEELIKWFFEKNTQNRPRVFGHSQDLTDLNSVLSSAEAKSAFIDKGYSLQDSVKYTKINSDGFFNELQVALRSLKHAQSFIHQIEDHNSNDFDALTEIINLSKTMQRTILAKTEEDDS